MFRSSNQRKIIKEREKMRTKNFAYYLLVLFVIAATVLSACGGTAATEAPAMTEAPVATEAPATAAPTEAPVVDPMADLIAAAQAEGTLSTIALPHDWCNYGEAIDTFKAKYELK
jgi:hypothetical protein